MPQDSGEDGEQALPAKLQKRSRHKLRRTRLGGAPQRGPVTRDPDTGVYHTLVPKMHAAVIAAVTERAAAAITDGSATSEGQAAAAQAGSAASPEGIAVLQVCPCWIFAP